MSNAGCEPAWPGWRSRGLEAIGSLLRHVGSWARRHPAAAVAVFVVVVLIGPLVPDFYRAIPWPLRKGAGAVGFALVVLVAAGRILVVRPTDDHLPARPRGGLGNVTGAAVLALACVTLAGPLLADPAGFGFGDWDLFLGKYEGVRRTLLEWGQFPWWDPWTRGGFPLAANPQCGVVGVATPLVLVFGTTVGMRLATVVCFAIAAEGARRLALRWIGEPKAAVLAGFIYALNGGVLVAAVAAYHLSMCYGALPWLLLCAFELGESRRAAVGLGFWMAFNLLNGIQYFSVYNVLVTAVVWLRACWVRRGSVRRGYLGRTVLALGVFLALAGWRIATTGLVYRDFPRHLTSGWAESPLSILVHLLNRPTPDLLRRMSAPHFWETTCYLGPVVFGLAVVSLAGGWRWWHTLALVCGLLASGGEGWHYPSYWLRHLPVFATMHVVTRWRFLAVLGVALAAASVLATWWRSPSRRVRGAAWAIAALVVADYMVYGFQVLPIAFSAPPLESLFPGPPVPGIVQVRQAPGYPAIHRGYGVIHGFEPLMGYDRGSPTARRWQNGPGYLGEHWTASGPVEPVFWSPNRIVLQVKPGETVHLNQNPGSWWIVNGRRPFAGSRCAEKERDFVVNADAQGRVEVRIRPNGLEAGWVLHAVGATLIGVALGAERIWWRGSRVRLPGGASAP